MKIKKNILLIINESYKWRNRELLETQNDQPVPKLNFWKLISSNKLLILIAILHSIFFSSILTDRFSGQVMTSLSIFIGLFLTVLILIFDKFVSNSFHQMTATKKDENLNRVNFIRTKNFTRRFVYVSLEGLLIAIVLVIILSITLLFTDIFERSLLDFDFTSDFNSASIKLFFQNLFVLLTRVITFILLIKFSMFLIYIVTALSAYVKGVFDKNINL